MVKRDGLMDTKRPERSGFNLGKVLGIAEGGREMLKEKKKHMVYLFIGLGLTGLFLLMPDMVYAAGSGVTELDNAANKTNTLVTWVCGWIGGLMALFGIIWAAINQASHNSEGRNQGIIVGAVGIIVAFAPQITNMILGK